jgi:CxxC motif-containing protein
MANKTTILCITCPKGCTLEVTHEGLTVLEVKPGCKRGHEYAQREITDPRRMVASSIKVANGVHPLLPVYTSAPFPKAQIMTLMNELRKISVHAPVKMGTVILENALGTGIDILASRDMPEKTLG